MLNEKARTEPYASASPWDAPRALHAWCLAREARTASATLSDTRAVDLAGLWLELESIKRDTDEHLASIRAAISRIEASHGEDSESTG